MNDNYIILRDEDGKAYIAHADAAITQQGGRQYANWGKGAQRAGHKYIDRLLENGKYWYAYTQQQLQAHLNGIKNKTKNAVEEATGVAARKRMDAAAEKYPELERKRQQNDKAYNDAFKNERRTGAQYLQSAVGTKVAEANANTSNVFNRKQRQTALETSRNQEAQYKKAYENAQKETANRYTQKERSDIDWGEGKREYEKNKEAYERSLAGIYDKNAPKVKETAASTFNQAKNTANNTVTKAKNTYDRMRDEFRDKAREAIGISDRERMDKAAERRDAWNNEVEKQRKNSESTKKEFEQALDDRSKAQRDEASAKTMYDNSSLFNRSKSKREYDAAKENTKAANREYQEALNDASRAQTSYSNAQKNADKAEETYQKEKASYDRSLAGIYDKTSSKAREIADNARDSVNEMLDTARNAAKNAGDKAKGTAESVLNNNVKPAAQATKNAIDSARTVAKDASENVAAKAKSDVDQATKAVQSMIDNARSATSKAVKDAWDNIPKNADGTVNPFDKDFSDAYNKWKTATAKYENSLTAKAKEQAKKAADAFDDAVKEARQKIQNGTATIQDYVNSGRETLKQLTSKRDKNEMSESEWLDAQSKKAAGVYPYTAWDGSAYRPNVETGEHLTSHTTKSKYSEYRSDDSDFAEKNYSDKNHVEDTDFYTFKRPDGRWVILEEDMKWVLPEGVTGNDPGIKNALKNFSDQVASTRSHGGTYTADQWVDDVTAAIDKAAERQSKKK